MLRGNGFELPALEEWSPANQPIRFSPSFDRTSTLSSSSVV
jgi:hypothetical protein